MNRDKIHNRLRIAISPTASFSIHICFCVICRLFPSFDKIKWTVFRWINVHKNIIWSIRGLRHIAPDIIIINAWIIMKYVMIKCYVKAELSIYAADNHFQQNS